MPSQGPNGCGTGGSAALAGNSDSWNNTGNVTANDSSTAFCTVGSGAYSNYLLATNFGFSIPAGATIDGIVVEFDKSVLGGNVEDKSVKLVKAGSVTGTEKASSTDWSTINNYVAQGTSSDLWGATWSVSDVNGSGFGAAIAGMGKAPGGGNPAIDHCRITVYYTEAVPPTAGIAWIRV